MENKLKQLKDKIALLSVKGKGNEALEVLKDGLKEVAEARDIQCRDELLKQIHLMKHTNGYPSWVVPKGTILELPSLMKSIPPIIDD